MTKWIFIGDFILNTDYFNIFYIEETPDGKYTIFGEDKAQICWTLDKYDDKEEASNLMKLFV